MENPTGWDTSLSRLFDFFGGLPRVLQSRGPREFQGRSDGFSFRLTAFAGRLELHVFESGAEQSEIFIADARVLSAQSSLGAFIELERRLDGSGGADVDISDILLKLPDIRGIYSLQSSDDRVLPTGSQRRQMAYLWDRAGLDQRYYLKLDAPYEIGSDHDDATVWSGDRLPLALGNLRPTLGISEHGRRTAFHVELVERIGSVIAAVDPKEDKVQPDPTHQAELDDFADRLRALAQRQALSS